MHKTKDVLDELRQKFGSDTKAARALGITQQSFSEWRTGQSYPGHAAQEKIAELLGWKVAYVHAIIAAETCDSAELRELFRNMAKGLRRAAVIAAMAIGAASFGGFNNNAFAGNSGTRADADPNMHSGSKRRRVLGVAL